MSTSTPAAAVEEAPRPLIQSKLEAPVPRRRVARRELLERCAGPPRKLTLIRAPAGWGKSTLLADWYALESETRPFAWVALDAGDNDPVRFWTYVIHAIRILDPGAGEASLRMLEAPRVSLVDAVLPALCNELAELPHQVVLVLDDYHLVTNPEIHESLAFLLEHLPRTVELVVASRSEPSLPLARLRARGELAEIDAQHLRFSDDEADDFLNDLHGLELDRGDVVRLRELTEGWPAGLYLATLTIRGRESAHEFIESFGDNRHVVDYLSSEVLAGLAEETRGFLLLLQTSILQRLCGSLCDAVTDRPGSVLMLHELERSNSFLIPLDTRREWYGYHQLFGELLRKELASVEPEHVHTLHRRACAWHKEHGDAAEAIHHATEAGDVADASELILGHWIEYRDRARLETLLAWLDALPPATVTGDARLCLVKASTLQEVGRVDEADEWLEAAARGVAVGSLLAGPASVASGVAACRAINRYFLGDVSGIGEIARPALELEEAGSDYWRSALLTTFGVSLFLSGKGRMACGLLDEAVTASEESGHTLALAHALGWCAVAHAEAGEDRAERVLDDTDTLRRGQAGLAQYFGMAMAHVARGKLLERQGRLSEADESLGRGTELARQGDAKFDLSYGLLTHAGVKGALGDRGAAEDMLREARRTAESCVEPGVLPDLVDRVERRLRLVRSRVARAPYEEDLSERELAVLRLLATELTQREIGEALFVSFNTVKTHVKSIFRKLDVATRPDAVSRARELRLL